MNRRLLALAFAATVYAAAPCLAVEATPSPTPASAEKPATDEATPTTIARNFFVHLGKGEIEEAYDGLLSGTRIAETPTDVLMLKKKTRDALEMVGGIRGAELLDRKTPGTHLQSLTYVSLGEHYPLQWRFFFYKRSGGWKLIDIRISDRLVELFGERDDAGSASPTDIKP